jgi:uncharacterized protein (TIGR04255 family)
VIVQGSAEGEEFFSKFGDAVAGNGYTRQSRLLPPSMPMIAGQPAVRWNLDNEGETQSLYQVGPGMFSANAVPPYGNWKEFREVVAAGVHALIHSRAMAEATAPIGSITLRYIDAFKDLHTQGKNPAAFIEGVIGIKVQLPDALTRHLLPGQPWRPFLQFQLPLAEGTTLALAVGEGAANGEPAVLMDTSIVRVGSFAPDAAQIMRSFDSAHDTISAIFKEMTASIKHIMPPKASEGQ